MPPNRPPSSRTRRPAKSGARAAKDLSPDATKKSAKRKRRNSNRHSVKPSASVLVALDNPNGIRWILEFAPIYASILHGIEQGLAAANKRMQVCSIRSPENFESLILDHPPDGLLFLASKNVIPLAPSIGRIPCVSVLGDPCDGFFDQVTYNNPATGRLPAEIFLKSGITTAAILGPTQPGRRTTFGVRYTSFVETMEDDKGTVIPLLSNDLYEPENPSNQPRSPEIARLVQTLKDSDPFPKGLYVMADNLLPTVHAHLLAAGIIPGKDMQMVSCNSESPYFANLPIELARVDIPAEEIGFRAVELLEWRTQHPGRKTATTVFTPSFHIPKGSPLVP